MRATIITITLLSGSTLPSCTLGKPLVCLATGPVYTLQRFDGWGELFQHPRDFCGSLAALGGVLFLSGPIVGLVNGAISDWNWMTGQVPFEESHRNLENPYLSNAPH